MNRNGVDLDVKGSGENVMFDLLGNLPLSSVTALVCMLAILVFFITAADSAANVMGSMSQSGRPVPSKPVTIIWSAALGLIAMFLLLAMGSFDAATASNLLLYQLLWLIPLVVLNFGLNR
jgi:choline-glycine betaine transporter